MAGAFASKCPSPLDWTQLINAVPEIVEAFAQNGRTVRKVGIWDVGLRLIQPIYGPLSPQHMSYEFLVAASHHENEQKNLISKIEDACAIFTKHADKCTASAARAIMQRLLRSASVPLCIDWANDYFQRKPNADIDLVYLYTPDVTRTSGQTMITHHVAPIMRPGALIVPFVVSFFAGTMAATPARQQLHVDGTTVSFDDRYVFQDGEIFELARQQGAGMSATGFKFGFIWESGLTTDHVYPNYATAVEAESVIKKAFAEAKDDIARFVGGEFFLVDWERAKSMFLALTMPGDLSSRLHCAKGRTVQTSASGAANQHSIPEANVARADVGNAASERRIKISHTNSANIKIM